MKKGTPHSEDPSYQQLFGALTRFISEGSLEQREVENAIATAETYLEKNPDLNFMKLFDLFHQNEQIAFTSFINQGMELARDERNSDASAKIISQGVEATRAAIDLCVDPFKKSLQEIELMIEATNEQINKIDEQTSPEAYAYYAHNLLPILEDVAERMRK